MTSGPVQNFLQAGLWLVYAFLPEMAGFGYFLLIFSFYFPIDITPLDSISVIIDAMSRKINRLWWNPNCHSNIIIKEILKGCVKNGTEENSMLYRTSTGETDGLQRCSHLYAGKCD